MRLGLTYRFASEENRRQFITNPERYVPQFAHYYWDAEVRDSA